MKNYEPSTPRTALGLIAMTLTALTIGVGVVLPAGSARDTATEPAIVATMPAGSDAAGAVELRYIDPVEVIAYRSPRLSSAQDGSAAPRRDRQG